jgi:hypothetical protein
MIIYLYLYIEFFVNFYNFLNFCNFCPHPTKQKKTNILTVYTLEIISRILFYVSLLIFLPKLLLPSFIVCRNFGTTSRHD